MRDFIEHCTHEFVWGEDMVLRRDSRESYVADALSNLAFDDPAEFLDTILAILHLDQSDDVMRSLAAPLEVLIESEPESVIAQVETLAARDSAFRRLLGWFMPTDPESPLWARLRRAAGDVPW